MTSARVRFTLMFLAEVEQRDIPDIKRLSSFCMTGFIEALSLIAARRDNAIPKIGALLGAYSAPFAAWAGDNNKSGRIVYTVSTLSISILAAHYDHDEAYRRARKRYKKRLRG